MSNVLGATVPAFFDSKNITNFTITNGTTAKVLIEQAAPAAAGVLSPLLWGGCTVIDLVATSDDSVDREISLFVGTVMTVQSNAGTMTTTTGSIPRTTGSYISDGWQVGDKAMVFSPRGTAPNAGVDGIPLLITAVSALGLSLNGTPIAALTLAAGTRIVKISPMTRIAVPALSGTNASKPNVTLLNNNSASIITNEKKLGVNDVLIGLMPVAVSALPACVSVAAQTAFY